VSDKALSCPKCGHQFRRPDDIANHSWVVIIGGSVLVLLVIFWLMYAKIF